MECMTSKTEIVNQKALSLKGWKILLKNPLFQLLQEAQIHINFIIFLKEQSLKISFILFSFFSWRLKMFLMIYFQYEIECEKQQLASAVFLKMFKLYSWQTVKVSQDFKEVKLLSA